jgi:ACS family tartrate transporter-like MFS transporter
MKKALAHILPLIGLAYLFAYMDRVNVSFAATQMNDDLRFSATIYGWAAGCSSSAMRCSRSRRT